MTELTFDCCDHCEHTDPHELPHDTPCDHGCNDEYALDEDGSDA